MRGNTLVDPTVVGLLQPFILAYWYGHPDDDPPAELREIIEPGRREIRGGHSNVKCVVLDPQGHVFDAFDAIPGEDWEGPWPETMPRYFTEQIRWDRERLGLSEPEAKLRDLRIPDRKGDERAVRVFVRLDDRGMPAYNAPAVEVATPADADWDALAWADAPRTVEAGVLMSCFRHVYPSGVMERQNKRTMVHYRIAKAEGTLTLAPAGADARRRFAVLRGKVTLTDEGTDGFAFAGELAAVLTYASDAPAVRTLRGVFEAKYPRSDPANGRQRKMALTAVLESLPAGTDE